MPEVLVGNAPIDRNNDSLPVSLKNYISAKDMGTRLPRETRTQLRKPRPVREDYEGELYSFVHDFLSDMPEEAVASAASAVLSFLTDQSLTNEQKKHEIDEVLDQTISGSQFEILCQIVQNLPAKVDAEMDRNEEDNENDELDEEDVNTNDDDDNDEPRFIPLNDPVRLRDKSIVRPQDIDAHWLDTKLESTPVTRHEVMECMQSLETNSFIERLQTFEKLLGLENFGLAKLFAKNTEVIYWYTKLALAETGVERERVLDTINELKLNIEQVAQDVMDQDLPEEVDLKYVGRPLDIPLNLNVKLPKGSTKFTAKNYEQYNVPPSENHLQVNWELRAVSDLPEYVQPALKSVQTLNVVQSKSCDVVLYTDDNMLLCAPTGAGKTNIAILAMAKCVSVYKARAVYIAPLKALAQELVQTLQASFADYNITIAELSGDQSLGREQLRTVDIVVCTPEKWDIISRKASNTELLRSVGLVIVDEIHLLHDERRGSVIENIVVRHKLQEVPPRLVGLSATLPNYEDVARFLDAPLSGVFFFDAQFRPVPLEQQFLGVTSQGPVKQFKITNEVCAEKVKEIVVGAGRQALVFVHSRRDTDVTRLMLAETTELSLDQIGIHHAGLDKEARSEAEERFRAGQYRVLVCTATLAWGVNLPAAAVIIKGTQFYDPSTEGWKQLSPQDVLQMFGRAGRPGFDLRGLGVIITTQKYVGYFASVATLSFPIQSYLLSSVTKSINAGIANHTIKSIDDGVNWLSQTFWAIRARQDPAMYGDDLSLTSIVHSALLKLQRAGACHYNYPLVKPTFQGELAAEFYISPDSIDTYVRQLKPWITDIDLIRVFTRAEEFSTLSVRRSESGEILRLAPLVPFPVRDDLSSLHAKINILLQAYVSRLPLKGLALSSDMAYIAQSASRLFRAFFELAIALKWGRLARTAHRFYLMVDSRLWIVGQSPLRQFPDCPPELVKRAEASQLPWSRYFDLQESDIQKILRLDTPDLAHTIYSYLQQFPRFSMSAVVKPLLTDWCLVSIEITRLFEFNEAYHYPFEQFWLLVEDQEGNLLYSSRLTMRELTAGLNLQKRAYINFKPSSASQKYAPYLFARLVSERWLYAEYETAIRARDLVPPSHITATSLLSEDVNKTSELSGFEISTSVVRALSPLVQSDRYAYIGLPPSSKEKHELFNLLLQYAISQNQRVLVVYPNPRTRDLDEQHSQLVRHVHVEEAERISRNPTDLESEFGPLDLVVCDDLHLIGSASNGHHYEVLVTRIMETFSGARIVGLGYPISSARSIAQWIGASKSDVVNFGFDVLEDPPRIDLIPWKGRQATVSAVESLLDGIKGVSTCLLICQTFSQYKLIRNVLKVQEKLGNSMSSVDVAVSQNLTELNTNRTSQRYELVVLFGTESLSSPSEVLDAISFGDGKVLIYSNEPEFYETCVEDVLPIESNLHNALASAFIPEIALRGRWGPQEAVDWISNTFLYRRLRSNPAFYGSLDLQDWVSEKVESTFEYLQANEVVNMDEESLELTPKVLAHILCRSGVDLEELLNEDGMNDDELYEMSVISTNRRVRVLDARINMAVATNNLKLLFSAVDSRQATRRAVPLGSSPLSQIPHFDEEIISRCQDAGIQTVQDFIAIEDDDFRSQLVGFSNDDANMLDIADFVNHFPIVDIVNTQFHSRSLSISIERDIEPDDEIDDDGWYVVVGNPTSNEIVGYKYIPQIDQPAMTVDVNMMNYDENVGSGGSGQLTVWLLCGNYIDADKQVAIDLHSM